ncbi:MAG: lysine 2,3-aminomutase [Spirochaetes bacterium GWD1_27_9]|nr:MAG: lysine 2,3-aminomutase [Spirochaetes bacterium GWB1_27_13]OHD25701.1 MAG: lysine 2,3-aminomutase [Spirochaetes bacterium GWC1_27_15]OHD32194.1 MAG: lysine 2,3-aminomutase [Spirochaetes bacterium GWD1_27_9]
MKPSFTVSIIDKSSQDEDPLQLPQSDLISTSTKSHSFLTNYFDNATKEDWEDWRWQIANSATTLDRLSDFLDLSEDEIKSFDSLKDFFPLRVTPYYLSLIQKDNPNDPLRKTVVPIINEHIHSSVEKEDPLNEDEHTPVEGIIHRYPDRVLFLVTGFCSTYCRYCTRSRLVGHKNICNIDCIENAISYIEKNTQIRDVIISGGDPLTLQDFEIEYILSKLRRIPHIEIIRIGTKVPVVLPQRITTNLVNILKKYHPLFMSIHFTHFNELTEETKQACERLADAGIPLGSQTVLLKDINDNVETMTKLMQGLLKIRVKPYYLYQCDPILGSSHFRTKVEKGLEIIKGLRGFTSGYAIPNFVIDSPGGGGKIPLLPEYFIGKDENNLLLKNYEDKIFKYPDYL